MLNTRKKIIPFSARATDLTSQDIAMSPTDPTTCFDAINSKADQTFVDGLADQIDQNTSDITTKADIVVQNPSCITLLSTGTDLVLPTEYTTITWQENPLLVGDMMTTDNSVVTFTKAGFVDLQITGEVSGAVEVQVLINGAVALYSHFIKITATETYESFQADMRRISVNANDTIELQVKSPDGTANLGILFIRQSF